MHVFGGKQTSSLLEDLAPHQVLLSAHCSFTGLGYSSVDPSVFFTPCTSLPQPPHNTWCLLAAECQALHHAPVILKGRITGTCAGIDAQIWVDVVFFQLITWWSFIMISCHLPVFTTMWSACSTYAKLYLLFPFLPVKVLRGQSAAVNHAN